MGRVRVVAAPGELRTPVYLGSRMSATNPRPREFLSGAKESAALRDVVAVLFVSFLLLSNIAATKLIGAIWARSTSYLTAARFCSP